MAAPDTTQHILNVCLCPAMLLKQIAFKLAQKSEKQKAKIPFPHKFFFSDAFFVSNAELKKSPVLFPGF
jgi:hypothetical protein